MFQRDEFHVFLPSNTLPTNNPSQFRVPLAIPLEFYPAKWDVALIDVAFTHGLYNVTDTDSFELMKAAEEVKKFAYKLKTGAEWSITSLSVLSAYKFEEKDGQYFVSAQSTTINNKTFQLRINNVDYEDAANVNITKFIGKESKIFKEDFNISLVFTKTAAISELFTIPKQFYTSIESIVDEMNASLHEKKRRNLAEFVQVGDKIKVDLLKENVQIRFHGNLNKILGFHSKLIAQTAIAENPIDIIPPGQSMYIYCNVCENSLVGDSFSPLLNVIFINSSENDNHHYTIKHPLYIPTIPSMFTYLHVELRTSNGSLFPIEKDSHVIVTIHFRKH